MGIYGQVQSSIDRTAVRTGNVCDRYITERSGLLDKLEEGDSVMADKGFNIRDLLTRKKVALNIPPLCKGTFPIKGANGVGVEEGMLKRKSPWTN